MKGFKDFLMQGNLVELATAFIMATAFAAVVKSLVVVFMDIIGKIGGSPSFSSYAPNGIHVGDFITALIGFVVIAAVVYFIIVVPYNKATSMRKSKVEVEADPTELELLVQIRDELRTQTRG